MKPCSLRSDGVTTIRLILLVALGFIACSKSTDPGDGLDGGSDAGPPPLASCETNVDCQGGEVCREAECRAACTDDTQCQDEFYRVCAEALGYCVRCNENSDCAASEFCEGNLCRAGCASDRDCRGGEACRERHCVSLDPIVCTAGSEQCRSGAIARCSADGTREETESCGATEVCVMTEGAPSCEPKVCEPNEIGCRDRETAYVCSEDGASKLDVSCRGGQFCEAGVCRNQVCPPNTRSCVGGQQVICSADGSSFETQNCADGCASEHGCACTSGECVERSCTPGEGQCVATGVRTCNSSGSGWSNPEACPDICVGGLCVSSTCEPGSSVCSGTQVLTCNELGTGYTVINCADDDEVCIVSSESASCAARVCTPDAVRCESGGAAVLVCDASGTTETREPCPTGQECDRGFCVDIPCVPDCVGRVCGPDPVCGQSCGGCAGTCTNAGQCELPANQGLEVRLSWSPSSVDLDLYLVKETGNACDAQTCYHGTCTNDATRPDWDGSGALSDGDPALSFGPGGIAGPGPEVIRLLAPGAVVYIAGVHYASSGTTPAMATVTFKRGGQTLGAVSRTLATGELWKGMAIDLSQPTPSPTNGVVEGTFEGCSGMGCAADAECPSGTYCSFTLPSIPVGTCAVGCRDDSTCPGGHCNGSHQCAADAATWGEPCTASSDCVAGLYCSILAHTCQEYCSTVGTCIGDPNCCPVSNALFCRQGALFASCSNTP